MLQADLQIAVDHRSESSSVDYKASFDTKSSAEWLEVLKDIVAFANSGGGAIIFGIADDGQISNFDCAALADLDSATVTDKVFKYMDSKGNKMAAIEERIAARMPGPAWGTFPGEEIRKICPAETDADDLYGTVDLYLADIAGYTVGVRNIRKLPLEALLKIKKRLSKPFYGYKGIDRYRALITPQTTPNLYKHLEAAEMNREDLVKLIDTIREEQHHGV